MVNCSQLDAPCAIHLPPDTPSGFAYRVEVHNATDESPAAPAALRVAARFLMQTTFGPRRAEVHDLAARLEQGNEQQVFTQWVQEQVAMPMSSHRGYLRARINSRAAAGAGRLACEPLSRWHRYAFTTDDVSDRSNVTVTVDANGVRSIFVGTRLRTQIRDFSTFDTTNELNVSVGSPWFGYLRRVGERVGGFFTTSWGLHWRGGISLDTDASCTRNAPTLKSFHHPPIDFVDPDPTTTLVLAADEATLQFLPWIGRTYDRGRGGYFTVGGSSGAPVSHTDVAIMTSRSGACTVSAANQGVAGGAFIMYNGTGYMHDPRVALSDNTLEGSGDARLQDDSGTGSATRLGMCHNVPKTFQNAHSCRPSTACSPVTYRDASVLLNHTSLRTFHQLTNSHVYVERAAPRRGRNLAMRGHCAVAQVTWRLVRSERDGARYGDDYDARAGDPRQHRRGQPVRARRHPKHGRRRQLRRQLQWRLGDRREGRRRWRLLGALTPI